MDCVSAGGRSIINEEEERAQNGIRDDFESEGARRSPENHRGNAARGKRDSGSVVDIKQGVRADLEAVQKADIRRLCVGLYEALEFDLPASGEARPEAKS